MKYGEDNRPDRRNKYTIDNFPAVTSSKTLLTHYLCSRVPDINPCISSRQNSCSIRLAIALSNCYSYHLGIDHCCNCQRSSAAAHDLASIGASTACMIYIHWWSSIVFVNLLVASHSLTSSKWASQLMVIHIKFNKTWACLRHHAVLLHASYNSCCSRLPSGIHMDSLIIVSKSTSLSNLSASWMRSG
jgi:hypothetical protein